MSKEPSFLDPLREAREHICAERGYLEQLAVAFNATGNEAMRGKLVFVVKQLRIAEELIDRGADMALAEVLGISAQGTTNMVNAVVASLSSGEQSRD